MVLALMLVLPIASIVLDDAPLSAVLVGTWFVFWAVGIRLLLAGIRQIVQPRYTAKTILGIESDDSLVLVRELGFANVAIGCIGAASLVVDGWWKPAAIAGAIFYGLAGINHTRHPGRNRLQNIAMVSDLFIAVVLSVALLASL
jgi:hypothetical protein